VRVPARDDPTKTAQPQRGIRPLLIATGVSVSGDGALNTAAPLLAAGLTNDPVAVAVVTAAVYAPWLFVSLPAGALVDRWPKRAVMVWVNVIQAAVLALFCVLLIVDQFVFPALVVAVLLVNVAQCFFTPAAQTVIPAIIGPDQDALRRANGRYVSLDGIGRAMIGPLGGAWIYTISRILPFLADAVTFVIAALFLRRLPPVPPSPGPHEPVLGAVRTAFRHLCRTRELFVIAMGTTAYNIGYFAAIGIFPLYISDILHVGEIWFGVLFAVLAVAGTITGWLGTGLIRGMSDVEVRAVTLAVPGLVWLVAAVFPNIWVTVALFASVGATAVLAATTMNSACQRLAPEGSLGRITSIFRLFAVGAMGIGALIGGWVAAGWGLLAPVIIAGIVQVVAGSAVWIFRR
jgi:MFS family permease